MALRAQTTETDVLGERLRREREDRGMSLRELARRLEVSPSLVSQIETGKIQPSVRTLYAMVSELGVSLDELFGTQAHAAGPVERPAEPVSDGHVQRSDSRRILDLESGVRWERLTTRNEPGAEFLLAVYPPGSDSTGAESLLRHTGREFGFVLEGRLEVTVGFDQYVLGPGDSVFFDSATPHRLHNAHDETVRALWVVLGRQP